MFPVARSAIVLIVLALRGGVPTVGDAESIRQREREAEPLYLEAVLLAERAGDLDSEGRVLDAVVAALRAGACPTRTLTEEAFADLHTQPRFREEIRDQARQSEIVMVTPREPGEPLRVSGVVRDAQGTPIEGALVFVYHTDVKGIYSLGGVDGSNPRLFGYLRTGKDGRYAYRTIRPASYPDRVRPVEQHVHYEAIAPGFRDLRTRLGFADDPFWAEQRRTLPSWAVPVRKDASGVTVCDLDVRMEKN